MDPAVVLLSGGLDSTTVLAIALQDFNVEALIFDYGQKHSIEIQHAQRIAHWMGASTSTIKLPRPGGSSLVNPAMPIPKGGTEGIPSTYVPARNTVFLAHALQHAEMIDANDIFIGVSSVDYSGYPDCRPEYIEAFQTMANLATKSATEDGHAVLIHAPLNYKTKAETIRRGLELGVDYSKTWSCYDPKSEMKLGMRLEPKLEYKPCNECDSCILRARAFQELGMTDPAQALADTAPG